MDVENGPPDTPCPRKKATHEERQEIASLAKAGVRNRRARHMQVCNLSLCIYLLDLSLFEMQNFQTN